MLRSRCLRLFLAHSVHIGKAAKEDEMKYTVKTSVERGGYREAARLMAEMREARRELAAARRNVQRAAA